MIDEDDERAWLERQRERLRTESNRTVALPDVREQALRARPHRRGLPSDKGIRNEAADNVLDRQFDSRAPNQTRIADFPYIWTAEGWLYVAAVINLFSRRLVGWSMSATMAAQLIADALMMAIWRRGKSDVAASFRSGQPRRTQPVVATQWLLAPRCNWSSASAGVLQLSVFRGRELRAAATAAIASIP